MTVSEKVAYLKGLAEGLGLDSQEKEGKLIAVIIETLDAVAAELAALNENQLAIGDELDELSSDLADVEDILFDDDCGDDCDCDCDCDCDDEEYSFDVKCPACGADFEAEESDLIMGEMPCPSCGEKLEFEFDDDEDEDDEDDDE